MYLFCNDLYETVEYIEDMPVNICHLTALYEAATMYYLGQMCYCYPVVIFQGLFMF